ncbi:hypothetical protein LTR10_018719 [Elasticomyces elasticus]|uniref:XPG-I domain-containing protein n=1 Tax=Exophiala sideris TaxID=1016849 RepID=A0ABR0JAD6_9EURO|nr:hypothetical protein LTR10_018719 [Elasticomyces elasticus]KAK5026244.1 hypothetical protein LTS07_007769 [Exophiala sideris]KAK5032497.1 hypothetical protein LTR13_007320 [Exophiala sideris]KAK5059656.1 hypothetical protein LTR69_006245 [Exophiala sideris]KAK5178060.1 hypothetical protein LTR44_009366 [Eurotiomycetes sp. CCFEE 6388]
MGVNKLWDVIRARHPQKKEDTVSLAQLGEEYLRKKGRPFRVAVDIYPQIFAHKGATDTIRDSGGMNHASKNIFYCAMQFLQAGIQPVFVYDGDDKPAFKRKKYHNYSHFNRAKHLIPKAAESSTTRTTEDKDRDQSLTHIVQLTKETFAILGLPCIDAAGEAEAECCALERLGLVDGVVTTDGDAFIFGSSLVLDVCNKDGNKPRRAYVYTSRNTMSRFGPNAVQDLYDAFGEELDKHLDSQDYVVGKVVAWSKQVATNLKQSSIPRSRALAEKLSRGFDKGVVRHYLEPRLHPTSLLKQWLREDAWIQPMKVSRLRLHTAEYFDWKGRNFARKFAKNLCEPLLAQYLMIQGLQYHAQQRLPDCGFLLNNAKMGDIVRIKVSYNPEQLLEMKVSAEPIIEGGRYSQKFDFDPAKDQAAWLPEWLIEYGTPVLHMKWRNSKSKSCKKVAPQKARKARKRSQRDDESYAQPTPKRTRISPPTTPSLHIPDSSDELPDAQTLLRKNTERFRPHSATSSPLPEFDKELSRATNLSMLDNGEVQVFDLTSSPC